MSQTLACIIEVMLCAVATHSQTLFCAPQALNRIPPPQAFGAGNYGLLGLVMQRAILICWVVSLPVLLLWSQAGPVLRLMHQSPEIIAGATRYLQLVAPTLFVSAVSSNVQRWVLWGGWVPTLCSS